MTLDVTLKNELDTAVVEPHQLVDEVVIQFKKCLHKETLFYLIFGVIIFLEILLFVFFLSPLVNAFFLGITLSILLFTLLFFSVMRLYFEEEKALAIQEIEDTYLQQCKKRYGYHEGVGAVHLKIAHALFRPITKLQELGSKVFELPFRLEKKIPHAAFLLEFFYRNDLLIMKERFLQASIVEHIKLVRCDPTNLEVHAALANAYVMLSSLYTTENGAEKTAPFWLKQSEKRKKGLQSRFRSACQKAMEEFSILQAFAPDDSWVHTQLAKSYRDLNMPEKEIQEFEILVALQPQDEDLLYTLGILYFKQGHNAKGLQVYERLKSQNLNKAKELIQYYGRYSDIVR